MSCFRFCKFPNGVRLRIYVYVCRKNLAYIYIYIYIFLSLVVRSRARVEELTQCNKFGFTCDTSLLRCVKSVDVRVSSLDPCPALPRVRVGHAAFGLMLGFKLQLFV